MIRLIPFYSEISKHNFVSEELIQPKEIESVKTSYLKCDTKISLIGISLTEAMSVEEDSDTEYELNPLVQLENICLINYGKCYEIDVSKHPLSEFTLNLESPYGIFKLDFETYPIKLNTDHGEIEFKVRMTGNINIETTCLYVQSDITSFTGDAGNPEVIGYTILTHRKKVFKTISNNISSWDPKIGIRAMIECERRDIKAAEARISELLAQLGPEFEDLDELDLECLMTAEAFVEYEVSGSIIPDDGSGYWAKETQKSSISCFTEQPAWATHVVWYNR